MAALARLRSVLSHTLVPNVGGAQTFGFNAGIVVNFGWRPQLFTLQSERYGVWPFFGASVLVSSLRGPMNKRILIADDGDEVRQVVRAVIEARTSYEVCGEAANGAEAVSKALELKPDLMLLDLAMPMLNGVEVASVLAGSMPDLPIILYTMYSELLGLSLAAAVGAKAVVSKADGIGKLIECMQMLLEPSTPVQGSAPTRIDLGGIGEAPKLSK
jgi:CheY-like chemotaxis protein